MLGLVPETIAPEKWRRLWRRRLRRRPLLPFLLAAFLAVDAVLLTLPDKWRSDQIDLATISVLGAQLSLLAIWTTHSRRQWLPRLCITVGLILAVTTQVDRSDAGSYVRPVIFVIFAFSSTGLLCLRAVLGSRLAKSRLRWRHRKQLGIATILWMTLAVAMLIAALREAQWQVLLDPLTLILSLIEVAPVLVIVLFDKLTQRGWTRRVFLVGGPAFLLFIAVVIAMSSRRVPSIIPIQQPSDFFPYYALESLLLGTTLFLLSPQVAREPKPVVVEQEPIPPASRSIDISV
jgi:hypothetical protein